MDSGTKSANDVITVDMFNKLTGQETLHPLVGLADLSGDRLSEDLRMPCNFYALICRPDGNGHEPPCDWSIRGRCSRYRPRSTATRKVIRV